MSKGNVKGSVRDLSGQEFGHWTVLSRGENYKSGAARWNCKCKCGLEKLVHAAYLITGKSSSCTSCANGEGEGHKTYKHGMRGGVYACWSNMLQRCRNPKHPQFHDYGGRGIVVCQRWRDSYEAFLTDMGPRPFAGAEIDRRDNEGGYEPTNCRWVDRTTNARNKRNSRRDVRVAI